MERARATLTTSLLGGCDFGFNFHTITDLGVLQKGLLNPGPMYLVCRKKDTYFEIDNPAAGAAWPLQNTAAFSISLNLLGFNVGSSVPVSFPSLC